MLVFVCVFSDNCLAVHFACEYERCDEFPFTMFYCIMCLSISARVNHYVYTLT